uniref:Uncharacterized protein n=1 Tax=Pararge aegeria TaxID=116150 RepID=S4NX79_9NEOP
MFSDFGPFNLDCTCLRLNFKCNRNTIEIIHKFVQKKIISFIFRRFAFTDCQTTIFVVHQLFFSIQRVRAI